MLVICEEHDIEIAEIQSDSLQVVLMLQRKISVSWRCYTWWRRILNRFNVCYSHCYREGNFAADYLAKEGGRLHVHHVYSSYYDLPRELKGICNLDRWGVPSLRTRGSTD